MMIDILLTAIILAGLALSALLNARQSDNHFFMSKSYTDWLKGICAIIVIMVHVKENQQNPLQDAIGSFAFVAVTFFFLFSAWGMQFSVENKKSYLSHFWRNRLTSLLIPCLLINLCVFLYHCIEGQSFLWREVFHISGYVQVLLQYCLLFYIVMVVSKWLDNKNKVLTDCLLVGGVIISSLYLYLLSDDNVLSSEKGWCYERFGLVWGLLAYRYRKPLLRWLNDQRKQKIVIALLLCLFIGVAYLKLKTEWFYGEYCLKIVLGFVIILFVFLVTQQLSFGNKISRLLGDISYEVYLSHGWIMNIIAAHYPSLRSGLFLILSVAITLLFSYLIHLVGSFAVKKLRAK